jgi:predicted GNAT family acetyltransferase
MHANGHHHEPLPPPTETATDEYLLSVVAALGDTPETVITLQFLRDGTCEVLCVGDPADLEALVIQSSEMPAEPIAFGSSAEGIGSLVPHLQPWGAINVPADLAADLVEPIAQAAGVSSVRLLDDVYHVLTEPVDKRLIGEARLLTSGDAGIVRAANALVGDDAARVLKTIDEGHVAGVIRDGELVSLAYTFATSDLHTDIGVVTREDARSQGLATMAGAAVSQAIQTDGKTPVWSTGSTNLASLKVAARLGFHEVSRRTYLIPEFDDLPADESTT